MNYRVPVWLKYSLNVEEASAYFGIGCKTLRQFIAEHDDENDDRRQAAAGARPDRRPDRRGVQQRACLKNACPCTAPQAEQGGTARKVKRAQTDHPLNSQHMINILVTITVSEQNRPQTLRLLEQLTEASQQENGNISYQHYLHPTDPEQLLIVELWQNGEVLAAHEATRHFTTLLPQIEKLSDGIDIRKFDAEPVVE